MILAPLWRCCFSHAVFINLLVVQIQLAEDYTLHRNVSLKIIPKKGVFMLVALVLYMFQRCFWSFGSCSFFGHVVFLHGVFISLLVVKIVR